MITLKTQVIGKITLNKIGINKMHELTDKHGNVLCFDSHGLKFIKCKWMNCILTLVMESFNKSLDDLDGFVGILHQGTPVKLTEDDISVVTEDEKVFFTASVDFSNVRDKDTFEC